ncbi:MAG: hypothetical protein IJH34_15130, partial [Romboutsia sp.]|nr:hypothetical protein [Romboutsia sp.]
ESPAEGIIDVQYEGNYILEGDKFAITDGNPETSWAGKAWNQHGSPSPTVIFDKEYEIDTIRFKTRYDGRYATTNDLYQTSVTYYDSEQDKNVTISNSEIRCRQIKDKNGVWYYEYKLPHKIKTNKIQVGAQVYPAYSYSISISEIKFYHYDSLKEGVESLFVDDLKLELSEDVTQEKIDDLRKRANTIDSKAMEYHPEQEQLLEDLQRAQDLLEDVKLNVVSFLSEPI